MNPGMVQAMPKGPHAGVDIAQAFPIGQLRKRHDKKLLVAGQRLHSPVPVVASNALVELILRFQTFTNYQVQMGITAQVLPIHQAPGASSVYTDKLYGCLPGKKRVRCLV